MILLLDMARDRRSTWTQRRRACLDLLALAYGRRGIVPPAAELVAGVAAELQGVVAAGPPSPRVVEGRPVRFTLVR